MTEITMDSDAGLALLWMAVFAPGAVHYRELAARMWPDGRDIRERVPLGSAAVHRLRAAYLRRTAWATAAVNKLILAGLAEVDPDKGEGWARLTEDGWKLAKAWGVKP